MKKVVMLSLVSALALSLTACGGSNNAGSSDNAGASTAPSSDATASATASASPSPSASQDLEFDLGGREIKVAAWWDATPAGDTPESQQVLKNIEELQKKHNFKLTFETFSYDQGSEKTTSSVLAGQPFADVVREEPGWAYPAMVNNDILMPLDDLIDVNGPEADFMDPIFKQTTKFNGKVYGWDFSWFDYSGIIYNRTLLQKLGMKDLQDYVADGTWTWDKLKEVIKQGTQGSDYGSAFFTEMFLEMALTSNNADFANLDTGKETITDPKAIAAMQFTFDVDSTPYHPEGNSGDWQYGTQAFTKGNVLMTTAYNWQLGDYKKNMGDIDIGYVPFPKGPDADGYYTQVMRPNFWAIPKGVKDADKVLYLMKKIFDVPSSTEYPGQDQLEKSYTNEKDINLVREMVKKPKMLDFKLIESSGFNIWAVMDELNKQRVSPATIAEKYKDIVQGAIDTAVKGLKK